MTSAPTKININVENVTTIANKMSFPWCEYEDDQPYPGSIDRAQVIDVMFGPGGGPGLASTYIHYLDPDTGREMAGDVAELTDPAIIAAAIEFQLAELAVYASAANEKRRQLVWLQMIQRGERPKGFDSEAKSA